MTKLIAILALSISLTLHAQSVPVPALADENGGLRIPKPPTVEELTAQVTEAKAENERLTKMLNAYAGKYMKCDLELTVQMTLGTQPTQAKPAPQRPPSKPPIK